MDRVLPAKTTVLLELQLIGSILFVLGGRVVALFTLCATKSHDITHVVILDTLPPGEGCLQC